jgi:hypothetical protein
MKIFTNSHRSGKQIIGDEVVHRVEGVLHGSTYVVHRNCAREFRKEILDELALDGWSGEVNINRTSRIAITSMRGRNGLCLQTGNMARFYADILKLQALFLDDIISSAFYLIPTLACTRIMGSNIANFERLNTELKNIFYKVITVPIVIIGFENGDDL